MRCILFILIMVKTLIYSTHDDNIINIFWKYSQCNLNRLLKTLYTGLTIYLKYQIKKNSFPKPRFTLSRHVISVAYFMPGNVAVLYLSRLGNDVSG
jgi:hypothetical protein